MKRPIQRKTYRWSFDDDKLQEPSDAPPPPDEDQPTLPGIEPPGPQDLSKHLTDEMREDIGQMR